MTILPPRFFICPSCGGLDIRPDAIPQMGQMFRCIDCGLRTAFVVEAETLDEARRLGAEIKRGAGDAPDEPSSQ